jgi:hypothetical protein
MVFNRIATFPSVGTFRFKIASGKGMKQTWKKLKSKLATKHFPQQPEARIKHESFK